MKYFEGKLDHYLQHVSRIHNILDDETISKKAAGVARQVLDEVSGDGQTNLIAIGAGRTRSAGMSRLLPNLAHDRLP